MKVVNYPAHLGHRLKSVLLFSLVFPLFLLVRFYGKIMPPLVLTGEALLVRHTHNGIYNNIPIDGDRRVESEANTLLSEGYELVAPNEMPDLYLPLVVKPFFPTITPSPTPTLTFTPTPVPTSTSTYTPTPTWTNTPTPKPLFDSVLHLDGVNDYATSANSVDVNTGDGDLTVEGWFYISNPDPYNNDPEVIACKWQSYCLYIERNSSSDADLITFRLWYGTNLINAWTKWLYFMTAGWHHLAGVYDSDMDETRLYYDGNLEMTGTFTRTVTTSTNGVSVGGLSGGNYFDGVIEEVRISDIPRYTGDSYTIQDTPFICDSHTRALWHFDETAGATIFYDGEDGSDNGCGSVEDTLTGLNGAATGPFP